MKRSLIERRLKVQEKFRPGKERRPAIIRYSYPFGAGQEELDRLAGEAREAFLKAHPRYDPRIPMVCLGLPEPDEGLLEYWAREGWSPSPGV